MKRPIQNRTNRRSWSAFGAAAVLGLAAQATLAQNTPRPGGPGDGPSPRDGRREGAPREAEKLDGTVTNYNFGHRGEVEGLMIKSGDRTVQVNLPPDMAAAVAQVAAVGSEVHLTADAERGPSDHPVYRFKSIKADDHELKVPGPEDEKFVHVEGSIKQLNYGRRGDMNGVILNTGDMIEFGPAARSLKLEVGQKIAADGAAHPMLTSGHQSIRAEALDGKPLRKGPPAEGDAPPPPPGPRDGPGHERPGPDGDGPPPATRGGQGPGARPGPDGAGPDANDRPRPPRGGPENSDGPGKPPAP
jgi:hypothetical protein